MTTPLGPDAEYWIKEVEGNVTRVVFRGFGKELRVRIDREPGLARLWRRFKGTDRDRSVLIATDYKNRDRDLRLEARTEGDALVVYSNLDYPKDGHRVYILVGKLLKIKSFEGVVPPP